MTNEDRAAYVDRFLSKVTIGAECWEHRGHVGTHGYPTATDPFTGLSGCAHRVGWKLLVGEVPDALFVCHRCNNKQCVRPSHLYLGTHKQNMDDMARAGHPRRKLSREAVLEIRRGDAPQRVLAKKHGVSQQAVCYVQKGITYRHVT